MKKLLPLLLLLIGIGGGVGAGIALRPDPAAKMADEACLPTDGALHAKSAKTAEDGENPPSNDPEYVKLDNQFVIPLVEDDSVQSLVVMSLSVEVEAGSSDAIHRHEPKLRDHFLEVLFAHANMGGFRGNFTQSNTLDVLRLGLLEAAQAVIGPSVTGVLITDLARRDG